MKITCRKRKLRSTLSGDSKRAKPCEDGNEERWGVLTKDVLELIFQRLNFRELGRAKLVCSHWLSVSKNVENLAPLLLVPHQKELCFFNPEDEKSFIMKNNVGFDFWEDSCCVLGSSHGCIIYLDEDSLVVVLNPLTGSRIQLPQLVFDNCIIVKDEGSYTGFEYLRTRSDVLEQHELREHLVEKVILSSNPFNGGNKFSVALIYGPRSELAYFDTEDHSWTCLDQDNCYYRDIIFHENKLYAVENMSNHVEVWDFSGNRPQKLLYLNPSNPTDCNYSPCTSLNWKIYLVESRGKMLLIRRRIADNTDGNGNEVLEPDLIPNDTNHPLVFPYGTVEFFVFELDMLKEQWIEVKSLDGCALFLGGNHSFSISVLQDFEGFKQNSIYFSDDCWGRMGEDNTYGGHDIGVFDMSARKVTVFDRFRGVRIQPSPFWIVPKLN